MTCWMRSTDCALLAGGAAGRLSVLLAMVIVALATATPVHAQETTLDDPYMWLENVTGDSALAWVRTQNARTEQALMSTPAAEALEKRLLSILDSDDRIPNVSKIGDYYYNFWQDAEHERGIWRRTTLEESAVAVSFGLNGWRDCGSGTLSGFEMAAVICNPGCAARRRDAGLWS